MSRREAFNRALDARPMLDEDDPAEWLRWACTSSELDAADRWLIRTATWDDLAACVAANQAEYDQRTARIEAMREVAELILKWCPDGGTVADARERCRVEGAADEHRRFESLCEAIAPGGVLVVEDHG